jgi:hypothetical protein
MEMMEYIEELTDKNNGVIQQQQKIHTEIERLNSELKVLVHLNVSNRKLKKRIQEKRQMS